MGVDRRDDRVGVVVEQRNDLLGLGAVGNAGVAAQVAEPQHRLDPVGDAALDAPAQHPPPRVAAEVGLDQGLGDPAERRRLDREPEVRNQTRDGVDVRVGKALRPVGHPARIERVHLADDAVGVEPVEDRDVFGERGLEQFAQDRKLGRRLGTDAPPQQGLAVGQHPEPRACPPALGGFAFRAAAVIGEGHVRLFPLPAERPPLVQADAGCR